MEPDQQPFEIWLQPHQTQVPTAPDSVRIPSGVPVGPGSIGIKKHQGNRITNS